MSQTYTPGDSERQRKKYKTTLAVLSSICLFLLVVCACLLTALILIGKHLVSNASPSKSPTRPFAHHFLARLPRDAVPIHYDLTLKPDLELGDYQGFVNVTVNVTRNRKEIFLHSKNLSIDKVQLSRANDSKVFHIGNVQENVHNEFIVILPKEQLFEGVYYVSVNFSGSMLDKLVGFYRSKAHLKTNGKPRYMATSKFEPTYARQAFPCFDEPNMKATYTVHILRPKDATYIALSNYPHNKEETVPEGTMVHFDKTVPMSTYLTCFIVSDFVATNTTFLNDGKEIPFKVFATPEQLDKTTYAGEVGKKVIEYYIDYFNIPYPLPKLDMVAIPDFVSGAMEHWGLVTFRETALLYTPKTHSAANKQRVATVVAHELAHSWFGNLVTMNWWNDLWLNEGFASYIEYKGTHHAEPDWGMLDQFLVEDLHPVLDLDATKASHPIITTVATPDQITEVFDTISYNKGAAILRMLEHVVGPENFRKGVTNYLNTHKFGNAITQYLWDELQAVVGNSVNITEFMDTYTVQMGYPILDVKVDGSKYTLTQKRFFTDPETISNPNDSPYKYKWSVPVSYITDKGESEILWFDHKSNELITNKPADTLFLKFNPSQVGYYRINYPEAEWRNFFNVMKEGILHVSDRTHLLEESFSIAASGAISYAVPLDLTKYLETEVEYTPWSVAASKLLALKRRLQDSPYEADFRNYVIKILKPAYANLTWNETTDELHLRKRARVVVLNLACAMGYKEALNEAKARFDDWIENQTELSQDLRGVIYKFGAVDADESTWNKLFDVFSKENDANEKIKLMVALASVQSPILIKKLIGLAKDEQYIRSQDYFTLLTYIADNPVGTPIIWDYVREHWIDVLVKRFTLNSRLLGRTIPTITKYFSTQVKLDELNQFFEKYPEAGAGAAARVIALDGVNTNIKWLNKYRKAVEDWIVENK